MSDRALAAAVALTRVRADGKALESLYASMLQYVRIYSEEVDAACAGNPLRQVRAERRECAAAATTGHLGTPCPAQFRKLLRAAVRNEDLPGALDVRLSNVYLHSLIEGCSAASVGPIA